MWGILLCLVVFQVEHLSLYGSLSCVSCQRYVVVALHEVWRVSLVMLAVER